MSRARLSPAIHRPAGICCGVPCLRIYKTLRANKLRMSSRSISSESTARIITFHRYHPEEYFRFFGGIPARNFGCGCRCSTMMPLLHSDISIGTFSKFQATCHGCASPQKIWPRPGQIGTCQKIASFARCSRIDVTAARNTVDILRQPPSRSRAMFCCRRHYRQRWHV